MPQKQSKAVPEGDGSFPYHDELGFDEPTMVELYRTL